MFTLSLILIATWVAIYLFMHTAKFGKNPSGSDLARVEKSPNYRNGQFQNLTNTPAMTEGENAYSYLRDLFFKKVEHKKPMLPIATHKIDLKTLHKDDNILVWLGHGSYYMQVDGIRLLIDPVLVAASPISFVGAPFKGSDIYTPADMPEFDYLLITHDHWDHLDYDTVRKLKTDKIRVVCPLGVGSHFRHWNWNDNQISELDWHKHIQLGSITLHALPSRHFSGRGFARNKTLWASYMLETSLGNIFLSGDGGYGQHLKMIKEEFGDIRFAVLENGQYDRKWADIHFMPNLLKETLADIQPQQFITVHNSKYALAQHSWYEPLENIYPYVENDSIHLLLPQIGDVVHLDAENDLSKAWWRANEN